MGMIVGAVLGFLSGLGIGGGSLLILWLTLVLGMGQEMARGINLLFYLPGAAIASCLRWKEGHVDLKTILPAVISGCLAAVSFTWLAAGANTELLKKLFGVLLVVTGIRELLYKGNSQAPQGR